VIVQAPLICKVFNILVQSLHRKGHTHSVIINLWRGFTKLSPITTLNTSLLVAGHL